MEVKARSHEIPAAVSPLLFWLDLQTHVNDGRGDNSLKKEKSIIEKLPFIQFKQSCIS